VTFVSPLLSVVALVSPDSFVSPTPAQPATATLTSPPTEPRNVRRVEVTALISIFQ
jgi:hypothetical protein